VDLLTIGLMMLAGLLHASWHALVKSGADRTANLAGMGIVAAVPAAIVIPFVPMPTPEIWLVLAASVALHVGYKLCVASAYGRADLGEAFPMARGAVPLFATVIAFLTLGQVPSLGQCIGIALISASLIVLSFERVYASFNAALLAAIAGAGLAVAAYSVLDSYGARQAETWVGFTAWLIVLDNVTFLLVGRLIRGPALWAKMFSMSGRIVASGFLGLISFGVFMWALSRNPVGAVSALRETSIFFAILIGVVLHQEKLSASRIGASVVIVTGIVTMAVFR
jgi:drug/metabolite transporter (DMT)-like permease